MDIDTMKELAAAILALVGALYGVARIVVMITPTPEDNKRLDAVAGWVRALCAAFGLTPFQGRIAK